MNTPYRLLLLPVLALTVASVNAGTFANITSDGDLSDWNGIAASYTDPSGDGTPGDINQIFIANNDTHLFILVTFYTAINPNANPSLFLGVDNDSDPATGFNVYELGLVGTEAGWQNDFPFEQATGVFNTGATTSGANAGIAPYYTETTYQEISISRSAIIDTATSQPVFPNNSFNLAVYFNTAPAVEGNVDDFAGPIPYTFASAIPEPATCAALAGLAILGFAFHRRRAARKLS